MSIDQTALLMPFMGLQRSLFQMPVNPQAWPQLGEAPGAATDRALAWADDTAQTLEPGWTDGLSTHGGRPAAPAVAGGPLVTVLGGTGFMGEHTVQALLNDGWRVRVMARNTSQLPAVFYLPGVERLRGDMDQQRDLECAVWGADAVIHLAQDGEAATYEDVPAALVDSALLVAHVCHAAGVQRLVHVGSIDSLFLGEAGQAVSGETPPDPCTGMRGALSRARAQAERALIDFHHHTGLPLVLLRAGLVVGAGASPFHEGLGHFRGESRCVGWSSGQNPLPWVLASDCASAISAALVAPAVVGRSYNLVGDVRPSAREYLAEVAHTLQCPLSFVPSSPTRQWLGEMGRWLLARLMGRPCERPSKRELLSRAMLAGFDCNDAKRDLLWQPVNEPAEFHRLALQVHAEETVA